ncbi:MAG: phosphoserine phosphatase SerB [Pseudomonadota bacterium]
MAKLNLVVTPGVDSQGQFIPLSEGLQKTLEASTLLEARRTGAGGLVFEPISPCCAGPVKTSLPELAKTHRFDWALQPEGQSLADFSVLVMDMDSTVINIECIDEIADYCGKKAEVAAITEATMRGEIKDFNESLTRRVAILKGLPTSALQAVLDERLRPNPGALEWVRAAKQAGLTCWLVSGGFTFFARAVADRLGFDAFHANVLDIDGQALTGRVNGEIINGEAKKRLLLEACAQKGVDPSKAIAVGDGANDLPMMSVAGLSIAYRAKPAVTAQAMRAIEFGRLDSPLVCWGP